MDISVTLYRQQDDNGQGVIDGGHFARSKQQGGTECGEGIRVMAAP